MVLKRPRICDTDSEEDDATIASTSKAKTSPQAQGSAHETQETSVGNIEQTTENTTSPSSPSRGSCGEPETPLQQPRKKRRRLRILSDDDDDSDSNTADGAVRAETKSGELAANAKEDAGSDSDDESVFPRNTKRADRRRIVGNADDESDSDDESVFPRHSKRAARMRRLGLDSDGMYDEEDNGEDEDAHEEEDDDGLEYENPYADYLRDDGDDEERARARYFADDCASESDDGGGGEGVFTQCDPPEYDSDDENDDGTWDPESRGTWEDGADARKKKFFEKEGDGSDDESDEDQSCEVCGSAREAYRMLLCDRCNKGYHTFCLDPKLDEIPVDDWYCETCTRLRMNGRSERQLTRRMQELAHDLSEEVKVEGLNTGPDFSHRALHFALENRTSSSSSSSRHILKKPLQDPIHHPLLNPITPVRNSQVLRRGKAALQNDIERERMKLTAAAKASKEESDDEDDESSDDEFAIDDFSAAIEKLKSQRSNSNSESKVEENAAKGGSKSNNSSTSSNEEKKSLSDRHSARAPVPSAFSGGGIPPRFSSSASAIMSSSSSSSSLRTAAPPAASSRSSSSSLSSLAASSSSSSSSTSPSSSSSAPSSSSRPSSNQVKSEQSAAQISKKNDVPPLSSNAPSAFSGAIALSESTHVAPMSKSAKKRQRRKKKRLRDEAEANANSAPPVAKRSKTEANASSSKSSSSKPSSSASNGKILKPGANKRKGVSVSGDTLRKMEAFMEAVDDDDTFKMFKCLQTGIPIVRISHFFALFRGWHQRQHDRLHDALQLVRTLTGAGFDARPKLPRELRSFLDSNWDVATRWDGAGALDTSFLRTSLRRFSAPMPTSVRYRGVFQYTQSWCDRVESGWFVAAERGDTAVMRKLIDDFGFDVNLRRRSTRKDTALIIAASKNNYRCVELLLDAGADVDALNEDGYSGLTLASTKGHIESVSLLCASGADVDQEVPLSTAYNSPATIAFEAFTTDHFEVVQTLIHYGASVDLGATNERTGEVVSLRYFAGVSGHSKMISKATKYARERVNEQKARVREAFARYPSVAGADIDNLIISYLKGE